MTKSRSVAMRTSLAVGASVAALTLAAGAAQAQSAGAPASAANSPSATQVTEVVVTARKKEETLQSVPLSVATVSGQKISREADTNILDLTNEFPNFQMTTGTINTLSAVAVRGISSYVQNGGYSPSVSFYTDGIYQGEPLNFNDNMLDVQRVELLLGPQGTLFGQNTIAGVVNVITNDPTPNPSGMIEARYGNYNYEDIRGFVNAPLGDGFYGRLSASDSLRDGYQTNTFTGQKQGNLNEQDVRGQLLKQFGNDTDVLFKIEYDGAHERAPAAQYATGGVSAGVVMPQTPVDVFSQLPSTQKFGRVSSTLKVDHHFDDGGHLTVLAGVHRTDDKDDLDQAGSADPRIESTVKNWEDDEVASAEVRYDSNPNARFRYTLGVNDTYEYTRLNRDYDYPPPEILLGGLGAYHFNIVTRSVVDNYSPSLFGSFDYDITSKLTLNVGLRYNPDRQTGNFNQNEYLLALLGPNVTDEAFVQSLLGPAHTGLLVANAPYYSSKIHQTFLPGTATLTYKFDPDKMVYIRYARGTKDGGFNFAPIPDPLPPTRAFAGEQLDSYEAGFKTEFFDHRLLIDGDVFYGDYKDLQIVDIIPIVPVGYAEVVRNAGKVKDPGAEINVTAVLAPGLQLRGDFGYADPTYVQFVSNAGVNFAGKPLGGTPKANGSVGLDYSRELPNGFSMVADVEDDIRGQRLLGAANTIQVALAGYSVLNANLTFTSPDRSYELTLWGRNITNEVYVTNYNNGSSFFPGIPLVSYGLPRMFGITFKKHFD